MTLHISVEESFAYKRFAFLQQLVWFFRIFSMEIFSKFIRVELRFDYSDI